jgi:hypothetical protein
MLSPKIGDFINGVETFEKIVSCVLSEEGDIYITEKGTRVFDHTMKKLCEIKDKETFVVWHSTQIRIRNPTGH